MLQPLFKSRLPTQSRYIEFSWRYEKTQPNPSKLQITEMNTNYKNSSTRNPKNSSKKSYNFKHAERVCTQNTQIQKKKLKHSHTWRLHGI